MAGSACAAISAMDISFEAPDGAPKAVQAPSVDWAAACAVSSEPIIPSSNPGVSTPVIATCRSLRRVWSDIYATPTPSKLDDLSRKWLGSGYGQPARYRRRIPAMGLL